MKIFKSKIDRLLTEQSRLAVKKQKVIDRKNEENSRIETKIKVLENYSQRVNKTAKNNVAEIDRQLAKNRELLQLEAKYNLKVVTDAKNVGNFHDILEVKDE